MAQPLPKTLLIGSCEPFSGKSAVVLGLMRQLVSMGLSLRYGKPLATSLDDLVDPHTGRDDTQTCDDDTKTCVDDDVQFIGSILKLGDEQLLPSLQALNVDSALARLLTGELEQQARLALEAVISQLQASSAADLVLLEAAGSLQEGMLYGLSLVQLALGLQAPVRRAPA